jgi:uncharacterized cupredoxin-like copper-binding protein
MVKRFAVIGLVVLLFTLVFGSTVSQAGAANGIFVVKVTMQEWHVDISPATVPVGVPVRFEITNNGKIPHELVLEKAGAVDESLSADVNGEDVDAEAENIQPGASKTMTWTFTEPGAYQAACHIKGHFEAGMMLPFTVEPANAPASQAHTPAAIFLAKGIEGGVLVHNYYGRKLNFTINDEEFEVPANSDLFIALDPDNTYNYSANVPGDDDSEVMDAVDVQAGAIAELSFYH